MASPSSSGRQTGRPACTNATSEFVVPRSIPTARVRQASLTFDWPGSAIWNSASTGTGRLLARAHALLVRRRLVQEAPVVAQADQRPLGLLDPIGRARLEAGADRGQRLGGARAHGLA